MERACQHQALTWADCVELAADSARLDELGRSASQQQAYEAAVQDVRARYASVGDYILMSKFGLPAVEGKAEVGGAPAKLVADRRCVPAAAAGVVYAEGEGGRDDEQCVLVPNDFPYHFAAGIHHYVLWKWRRGGATEGTAPAPAGTAAAAGTAGQVTPAELSAAERSLRQRFGSRLLGCASFANPGALRSIPELDHWHLLVQLAPEAPEAPEEGARGDAACETMRIAERHRALLVAPDEAGVAAAALRLRKGELLAFPTETV